MLRPLLWHYRFGSLAQVPCDLVLPFGGFLSTFLLRDNSDEVGLCKLSIIDFTDCADVSELDVTGAGESTSSSTSESSCKSSPELLSLRVHHRQSLRPIHPLLPPNYLISYDHSSHYLPFKISYQLFLYHVHKCLFKGHLQ